MGNKLISLDPSPKKTRYVDFTYSDISMVAQPSRTKNGYGDEFKVDRNLDVNAVKRSVRNMFEWIPGERIILPEYGNKLREYLYEGITDFTSEKIISEIKNMCMKWEPRCFIDKVFRKENIEETENNQMTIVMVWHVVGLPEQQYQEEIML